MIPPLPLKYTKQLTKRVGVVVRLRYIKLEDDSGKAHLAEQFAEFPLCMVTPGRRWKDVLVLSRSEVCQSCLKRAGKLGAIEKVSRPFSIMVPYGEGA